MTEESKDLSVNPGDQQQPQASQGVDPNLIAQAVAEGMARADAQRQGQQDSQRVAQMTPEERAEHFQIFNVADKGYLEKFRKAFNDAESPEEQAAVLAEFRDGVVNQSLRGAELLMEEKFAKFQQDFAPARQLAVQSQQEQLWKSFADAHPELAEHRELVDSVATQLATTGYKPASPQEAFTKISEACKNILLKAGVTLQSNNSGGEQRPAMAQMSSRGNAGQSNAPRPSGDGRGVATFFKNRRGA